MALKLNKNWVVLLIALSVGGLAAFGAKKYINGRVTEIEEKSKNVATVKVVVAKKDLKKGVVISSENMAVRDIPKDWAGSGAISQDQFANASGSKLLAPAVAGAPVLWAQLAPPKPPTLANHVAEGKRAVTVAVDEISSLSGLVQPEDLVDIVVNMKKDSRNLTFSLVQNIKVLATGSNISSETLDANGKPLTFTTITLEATPDQARRLVAAKEIGSLTALLRSPEDGGDATMIKADTEDLLGLRKPASSVVSSVPVIYGGGPISVGLNIRQPTKPNEVNANAGALGAPRLQP